MNLKQFKQSRMEPCLSAGLIILAGALTYGILIPKLGFYRDDWYMLWSGQSNDGLAGIIRLFQTDRPLIGWTYALIFNFIGPNVLLWQTLGLVLKIFTGLSVLWLLRLVWPARRQETTAAALLFVLYPGFYQQPVAGTFIIDLLGLNSIFISLALTIFAIKSSNRLLQALATLASMALGLLNLGLYEATIGLEVVRWALVWLALRQKKPAQANPDEIEDQTSARKEPKKTGPLATTGRVFLALAPYFLMLGMFLYWRLFIFKSVRRATNIDLLLAEYASNPLFSAGQIIGDYVKDLFETVVLAWFVPFYQFTAEGRFSIFLAALGTALLVLALAGAYFFWLKRYDSMEASQTALENRLEGQEPDYTGANNNDFLWMGLIAVLVPTAVIVLLGRNVLFSIQWDRYTTQSMLGVGLLVSGLIFRFLHGKARWTVLAGLLVLAVMTHYHSAAYYARFWDYERNVIWQLSWRAPGLQPGTTLIVSLPEGTRLAEEYEIWGPANMAYFPGQSMQVTGQVPTDDMILDLQAKTLDTRLMRNINVVRDFGKPLIISLPSARSCVHVLDGQRLALPFFENGQIKEIAGYSNIQLIDPTAAPVTPSPRIFSAEPPHGWCYYYQKIGLALQSGDYILASRLADEASQKNLNPADESEWVPVGEAYANAGDSRKANATLKKIGKDLRKYICLQRPEVEPSGGFIPLLCNSN
ncbi:MAG TPA: hypothetical protein VGK00_12205 [Anaerolineales bacterium]